MESQNQQPASIQDLQPKMRLQGTVKATQLYGAIVDIGLERDGLVHISQLAPNRVNRVTDVVSPGDTVTVWVTQVDLAKGHIGLTMVEPSRVDWQELAEGQTHTGTVTRLEPYGAFVDIGAERPGLLHVREMGAGYVRHPSEVVKLGEELEVRVTKLDRQKRRIDLGMAHLAEEEGGEEEGEEDVEEEAPPLMTAMEAALQRAQESQPKSPRKQRHQKQSLDLSEQEDILARTLQQHTRQKGESA